jgi:hypothetical protein
MPVRVEDRGESEGFPVMGRIGDAMIAPTRKGADFRVVAYREIGLLYLTPEGMETSLRG